MTIFKKTALTILIGIAGLAPSYSVFAAPPGQVTEDALKTVELVPVKFEKKPVHAPVRMVENGKLKFAIVADLQAEKRMRSKNKTELSITPAIEILKEAIRKCTGTEPAVLDVKDAAKAQFLIVVGDNEITRKNGIDVTKLPPQGLAVKTFDRGIILAGNDSSLIAGYNMKPLEARGSSTGTKYAAYDFVERFLGVRYFFPGEYGTIWPEIKDLTLTPVSYTDAPYMDGRNGIFYLGDSIRKPASKKYWEPYLGKLNDTDHLFWDRWRMGRTIPGGGTHCPFPEKIAKSYPDKLETIFYKSPAGNLWYNPKAHIGNYYDPVNFAFADLLIESAKKFYQSGGKIDEGGFSHACNSTYFSFGICDTLLPDTELISHPIVKKLGLMTEKDLKRYGKAGTSSSAAMANVYGRLHQYLANKLKKEIPGTSLYIMAYYNVQYAADDPRWTLPDNTEVFLCLGDIPNKIRSPKKREFILQVTKEWYESLGNRPVQGLWLYTGTNPFVQAVNGEMVGDIPKVLGKYFGRTTMFFDHCINAPGHIWHYYYSSYAAYRSMWNPNWDAAAAIDAHWEPFYGKETGKALREFHQLLRDCYMKYALNAEGTSINVVYPMPELLKMEKLLARAQASVKPGTVEAQRLKLFMAPWKKAIESVKNQLAYERPVYSVYQLLRRDKVTVDGKGNEAFWAKVKPMKLMDPKGSNTPIKYPASIKLAWDKTGIYGLFETKYPTTVDAKQDVFYNDNFEIFFSPGLGKEVEFQFVFDPLKQMFLGTKRHLPIPQPFDSFWKAPGFKLESRYGKDYWTAEFYIPFSVFKTENSVPAVYDTWHCNIVRNKAGSNREYSGTAMTLGNNHNLNMYGLIKFAGKGE